jgi:two-component system chemotaxis response regulator CheB
MQKNSLLPNKAEPGDATQKNVNALPTMTKATKPSDLPGSLSSPIRVVVAEDSTICRKALVSLLEKSPGIQVIGTANNGAEAVRMVQRLKPDLVTMDINMPVMDGYEATRQIMKETPCPIVMISSNFDGIHTFDALKAGALTVLKKPTAGDSPEMQAALVSQVRLMADVKVFRHWPGERNKNGRTPLAPKAPPTDVFLPAGIRPRLVAIAASTGGPGALASVLRPLPADFPVPILVVQHISVGFASSFATWLDRQVALSVRIGRQDEEPKPGEVLIAPDHCHMGINKKGRIVLQDKMPKENICPSANFLFQSVANAYGAMTIGVVLTGMGDDGADGLQAMHEKGAYTIAQNKETCVVFGMPAVAIERGVIKQVQPLDQIGSTLARLAQA